MKFKVFLLLISLFLLVGCTSSFNIDDYKTAPLNMVLQEEGITTDFNFNNYDEKKALVTIYLFRGQGCSHCYDFLNFVANDLLKEYGNTIRVQSYEVWKNSKNNELMGLVKEKMGDADKKGVPYIVIGETAFYGYMDFMADEIRGAISEAQSSANKFDVLKELSK